jgi:molybdopterin/thiamine biosynthesis adenylyltransferase
LSAEQSSVRNSQTYNWQGPLSKANIYVLGSIATGQSVARNLYRAGARKITLVNVDAESGIDDQYSLAIEQNSEKFCQTVDCEWTIVNIEKQIGPAEIIIDTLSDWQKKLTLSDISMEYEKVVVHSGITGFRFQIYTMIPGKSACLRCALPLAGIDQVPLKPTNNFSISAVMELVDAWLSLEAIKYLSKIGIIQGNEMFKFDCLSGEFEVIRGLDANIDCPDCGRKLGKRNP